MPRAIKCRRDLTELVSKGPRCEQDDNDKCAAGYEDGQHVMTLVQSHFGRLGLSVCHPGSYAGPVTIATSGRSWRVDLGR